jgi:basic amino acid/polyamine antiporter, APA family
MRMLGAQRADRATLVSKRRRVQGRQLARDLTIAGAGALFSMWVTFAAGWAAVYQAMILVLAGVVLYAFLKAHREDTGQVDAPQDNPPVSQQACGGGE